MVGEWQSVFPMLRRYRTGFLLRRVDCFLIGLDLCNEYHDKDRYHVSLTAVPLYDNLMLKKMLPIISENLKSDTRLRLTDSIGYSLHDYYFESCSRQAATQFGKFMQPQVKMSDIIDAALNSFSYRIGRRSDLLTLQLVAATYLDNTSYRDYILERIRTELPAPGNYLQLSNKEYLTKIIHENIEHYPAINNLPQGHIVMDFDPTKKPTLWQRFVNLFFED